METIYREGALSVSANIALSVQVCARALAESLTEYTFDLAWDAENTEAGQVRVLWELPCVGAQYMWHPDARIHRAFDSDWRQKYQSMLTGSAPLAIAFNGADENVCAFAASEVRKVAALHLGAHDADNTLHADFRMNLNQFRGQPPRTQIRIRADFRRIPFHQAIGDACRWWDETLRIRPLPAPESCFKPLYSTWYNFHQAVTAEKIERECALAKQLGMETVIVDDGWQSEHDGPGYGHTGDWNVCAQKFPDMAGHVRRVHALGMKYMLWYSVPFIGYHAANFPHFEKKLLRRIERNECGVLDPRYPDVREYLIGIYEHAVRAYGLDGLKLDFIDQFEDVEQAPLRPEMDYACVQEAAERLMNDVTERLRAIRPEIMIEFRQRYIGPMMHRFGNMFRVGDCASDIVMNRVCIADLRLIGGGAATHSDMLTWNNGESVEDAALQILNSIFGVIQFSQIIEQMPESHLRMTRFWLNFARENEKVLLHSEFIPQEPQFLYPVLRAQDADTAIIGVYAPNKIVAIKGAHARLKLINATQAEEICLRFARPCTARLVIRSAMGEIVRTERRTFRAAIETVSVPCSGLAELELEK